MERPSRLAAFGALLLLAPWTPVVRSAEPSSDEQEMQEQIREIFERMPAARRDMLSGGALNLWSFAESGVGFLEREHPEGARALGARKAGSARLAGSVSGQLQDVARVSDPTADFLLSHGGGFTQSETSAAWCGTNVVVGYNDSGSTLEVRVAGLRNRSFVGVSHSEDNGASFVDIGFLNPGLAPTPNFVSLGGDPVTVCSSPSMFHMASLYFSSAPAPAVPLTGVSVSTSTDGGANWLDPVPAVTKSALDHFLDKEWMAVDASNPNNIYVTYTDFQNLGASPTCSPTQFPTTIELVRSTDGGATWSAPVVLDEVCLLSSLLQGSQVVVGPTGDVNVAWLASANGIQFEQRFRRSTDGGATFAPRVKASDVVCTGVCGVLEGGFRTLMFPSLAVDRSGGPRNGSLYLAWEDGRGRQVADLLGRTQGYNYADVLVSRSTNGGATWSAPVLVNTDRPARTTDQYQPGVAVDRLGRVGACYYDRSLDKDNLLITRTCSVSRDGGLHWTEQRITEAGMPPVHAGDVLVNTRYMGDYDSLASDATLRHKGFVGGFGVQDIRANADVLTNRLK